MGEYRHMGIGTRLLSEVMNVQTCLSKVILTEKDPKASEFYEKMGFRALRNMDVFHMLF